MGRLFNHYIDSYKMNTPEWKEYLEIAGDLYNSPQLQRLSEVEHHFDINRLQHIRSVAYLSYVVSKKFGLDTVEAARGATLHDLVYYDWRENDWSHRPHGFRHPGFAVKNAYLLCGTITKKQKNIIKRHMWPLTPIPPRYPEGLVVTLMDKYCATIEIYYSKSEKFKKRLSKRVGNI